MDALQTLVGAWHGCGTGEFPTIEPFAYDEQLVFSWAAPGSVLHYAQTTSDRTTGAPVHAEAGYLRELEDGSIELCNAQNSFRVEVLSGTHERLASGGWHIDLASKHYGNDERMISSRRRITVDAHELVYLVDMQTTTTDEPRSLRHLEARLARVT